MSCNTSRKFSFLSLVFIFCFILFVQNSFSRDIQCVQTKAANIREGAGTNHKILFRAWQYEPLTVLEYKGNWARVAEHYRGTPKKRILTGGHPKGLTGWIRKDLIKRERCISIRAGVLRLRAGPGRQYKTECRIKWGYSFKYLTKSGIWYKVTDGTSTGWVSSKFVWSPWL
jgi:uncharacterized protein YgiM (DUF1202 family)